MNYRCQKLWSNLRSAECAGVDAVVIPLKGMAPINADSIKHRLEHSQKYLFAVLQA